MKGRPKMDAEVMAALRAALEEDASLQARFQAASTDDEVVALAREAGVVLDVAALAPAGELSDAELEVVSGGYTFPRTDWIYCDNPWTNVYCSLKC